MASHGNHGRRVPAPAAAQGQDTAAPTRSPTGVLTLYILSARTLPEGHFPKRLRITPSVSGPTGRCWVTHWAISLTTTPSYLTATTFQTRRTNPTSKTIWCAGMPTGTIKLLIANGPDEAALAGRLQARLPSQPPIVFVGARCAASSEIDRPYVSVCHERVARFGAAGASRHPSRVRRARRITAGCTERRRVSLAGARAAARRGVHLLARRLRACVDRSAGGAAGALHCLSGHAQFR